MLSFIKNFKVLILSISLFLGLFAGTMEKSYAQSVPSTTTTSNCSPSSVNFNCGLDTDVSKGVLQAIIGDWNKAAPDPTMGALFKYFNLGVLVFGACLFMYVSVVGTMKSAEDGEVLGRNWGSVFVPIRVAGGMALLFPLANGLSGVQILVLWLATNGIGFANYVTVHTVDDFAKSQGSVIVTQMMDRKSLHETMKTIIQAEVCVAELNQNVRNENLGFNADGKSFGGPFVEKGDGVSNSYGRITWGEPPDVFGDAVTNDPMGDNPVLIGGGAIANQLNVNECGSITIPNFNAPFGGGSGGLSDGLSAAYAVASGAFSGYDIISANTQLRLAHFRAITRSAQALRPYAQAFVSTDPNIKKPTPNNLAEIVAQESLKYQLYIEGEMNTNGMIPSTDSIMKPMLDGVKKAGWANLGTFFYQFARINTELSKMTRYVPKIGHPKGIESEQSIAMTDALKSAIEKGTPNPATVEEINNAGRAQGGIIGGATSASNSLTNNATRWMGEAFGVDPNNKTNAMMQLKNVGDNILTAAEVLYIAKLAASATPIGKAAEIGGSATKMFGPISQAIADDTWSVMKFVGFFAVFALLTFGMVLAFWVPMTPFILWLGAVCGWLIAVLEMVVAAPLWAAAHLHPEGEGMASKYGANGYMIIMEVFAKPVLMVIGFFIASKFVDVFLRFASGLFFNNMATVNGDSLSGIVTFLAFMFMYVSFCVTMVNRCFTLIHVIPNSVLRWVGANGRDEFTQVGDISQQMHGDMKHTMDNALSPLRQGANMKKAADEMKKNGGDRIINGDKDQHPVS